MKKIIALVLVLTAITFVFAGCGAKDDCFTGQWKFSKISTVEIVPDADESLIADLKLEYGAEDEAGIEAGALAMFNTDGTFEPCYLNFDKKLAYTYDPIMEREATWAFYQTGDNEGFISVYTELDVADGNPDPITNPVVVYNADNDTMLLTLKYAAFLVTVELSK